MSLTQHFPKAHFKSGEGLFLTGSCIPEAFGEVSPEIRQIEQERIAGESGK